MLTPERLTEVLYEWWRQAFKQQGIPIGFQSAIDISQERNKIFLRTPDHKQVIGFTKTLESERESYLSDQRAKPKRDKELIPQLALFVYNFNIGSHLNEAILRVLNGEDVISTTDAGSFIEGICEGRTTHDEAESLRQRYFTNLDEKLRIADKNFKADYRRTFVRPCLYFGGISYGGEERRGVLVRAPIIRVPIGEQGGISEKLLYYSKAFVVVPLMQAVSQE